MEARMIGREYHQAGVIYVCSGYERDMLDSGNRADLHLSTAPQLPLSFPRFPSLWVSTRIVHCKVIYFLLTVPFFPSRCFLLTVCKSLFSSASERAVYTNRLSKPCQIPLLRVDTNLTCEKYNGLFACCTAWRETSFPPPERL